MKRKGSFWIALGLLLITAALFLTGRNLSESRRAKESSTEIMMQLDASGKRKNQDSGAAPSDFVTEPSLPDYVRNPDMEMPVETIQGNEYIGVLTIPALDLELPVMSQWSYSKLNVAPCRYAGSAYQNNMILLAHNFPSHFGGLKKLSIADPVFFADVDGNVFCYEVVELEVLDADAVEEMESGDWDLTLFTCTVGGKSRLTVRCLLAES